MEHTTTIFVGEKLCTAGLKPALLPNTSLVADIDEDEPADSEIGGERPGRLAFRRDMDALPITEATGLGFASTNDGVMRAYGHDFHTTITLVATLIMAGYHEKYALPTPLRFILQPAEEAMVGGISEVIVAGTLNDVECIFAAHYEPKLRVGHIGVRTGATTSTAGVLEIQVYGPGGHTSRPQVTADVVYTLGKLIVDLPGLLLRRVDPRTGTVLTFSSAHSGYAHNATSSEGSVSGTLRAAGIRTQHDIDPLVRDLIEQVLAPTGTDCTINYEHGVPSILNGEYCIALTAEVVQRMNEDAVIQVPQSSGDEDFGWYPEHIPDAMVRLGR